MNSFKLYIFFLILCSLLFSCGDELKNSTLGENSLVKQFPEFPSLIIPDNNKLTADKIELGRLLFYEKLLSKDTSVSCSSCHRQEQAFASKGNAVNPSVGGQANFRNVPPVFNIGFYNNYFWDGRSNSLEQMFTDDLSALTIFHNDTNLVIQRLQSDNNYVISFKIAFGDKKVTVERIAGAIASFVRSIVSGESRYDLYLRGDTSALNSKEIEGMKLFFSERTNCNKCHTAPLFTDLKYHSTGITTHYFDFGRYYVTGNYSDRGTFRTPSVRNIELTAPYMHDGEIASLEELIENYNLGGKPFINKSELMKPLNLTAEEKISLISFLRALTDVNLISSINYSSKK